MARRLRNWSYSDVVRFLKENGFSFLKELRGSHEAWIKQAEKGKPDRIVEVNFTHKTYPVGTMKTMVRQSGIDEQNWILWAES